MTSQKTVKRFTLSQTDRQTEPLRHKVSHLFCNKIGNIRITLTLWRVRVTSCYENATMVDLHVNVNNAKVFSVVMEMQQLVPFALLTSYKSFALPSTIQTYLVLHATCTIFLSDFNQMWSFSINFRKSLQCQISRKSVQWKSR